MLPFLSSIGFSIPSFQLFMLADFPSNFAKLTLLRFLQVVVFRKKCPHVHGYALLRIRTCVTGLVETTFPYFSIEDACIISPVSGIQA